MITVKRTGWTTTDEYVQISIVNSLHTVVFKNIYPKDWCTPIAWSRFRQYILCYWRHRNGEQALSWVFTQSLLLDHSLRENFLPLVGSWGSSPDISGSLPSFNVSSDNGHFTLAGNFVWRCRSSLQEFLVRHFFNLSDMFDVTDGFREACWSEQWIWPCSYCAENCHTLTGKS